MRDSVNISQLNTAKREHVRSIRFKVKVADTMTRYCVKREHEMCESFETYAMANKKYLPTHSTPARK